MAADLPKVWSVSTIVLMRTCEACPEQYDAFLYRRGDASLERVGYLRLRHGEFRVECPWVGGEEVYIAWPKGDGEFEKDERAEILEQAKSAILRWVRRTGAVQVEPKP